MQVIPAIDIRGGRCARLFKGDYEKETAFDDDPVDAALRWVDAGAQRLHVIDLDGAKDGYRVNASSVRRIIEAIKVPVQVGGGIRSAIDAEEILDLGAETAIFGTAAVETPDEVGEAVQHLGQQKICVSVDALDGMVRTRGWLEGTSLNAIDLINELADEKGVRRFIYTDTSRDGTLSHPNFDAVAEIVSAIKYPVVAAGGIATIGDLLQLKHLGASGAITGMAIYTGAVDLEAAIQAVENA